MNDDDIISRFASVAQIYICSVASVTLWSIYRRGYSDAYRPAGAIIRDLGFMWFSLACAIWCASAFFKIEGWERLRTFVSVPNSVCVLGAALFLDVYIEMYSQRIAPAIHQHRWMVWSGAALAAMLFGLFCALTLLDDPEQGPHYQNIIDFATSTVVVAVLLIGLALSFRKRGFRLLAVVAVIVLGFQVLAQVPELATVRHLGFFKNRVLHALVVNKWQLLLSSKTMECILFVGLSFSWIHEKAEQKTQELRSSWELIETIIVDPHTIPKLPLPPSLGTQADLGCLPSKEFGGAPFQMSTAQERL